LAKKLALNIIGLVFEARMGKLFGTDGIRGRAGKYPLDYPTVFSLGQSLIHLLLARTSNPRVIIGWDTRESSPWLARAIAEGIVSARGRVELAGVLPTSAISFITRTRHYDAGVVISASHNPYEDNGIKIFQSDGLKLNDALEEELERIIFKKIDAESEGNSGKEAEKYEESIKGSSQWAEKKINPALVEDYLQFLASNFTCSSASSLKIVIDCSNGASSSIAPVLFERLGFKIRVMSDAPDGRNINAGCGALYPENLARSVQEWQADLGVAYDGDADRAIFVDEKGKILNGDYTLFIQARFLQKKNKLRSPLIVATIMSNMGLEVALARLGLKLIRTKVGDRYVLEEMLRCSAQLGGERSGHTIFLDIFPAGDGLLTSLKMAETMIETGQKLSELGAELVEFPQLLINVPVRQKIDFSLIPDFEATLRQARERLGSSGRIEVRYSGTEPVARIMVEGEKEEMVKESAGELAALIKKHLGTEI